MRALARAATYHLPQALKDICKSNDAHDTLVEYTHFSGTRDGWGVRARPLV